MQQYQPFEMLYAAQIKLFIHLEGCVSIVIIVWFCLNKESMYNIKTRKFQLQHGSPPLTVTVKARM